MFEGKFSRYFMELMFNFCAQNFNQSVLACEIIVLARPNSLCLYSDRIFSIFVTVSSSASISLIVIDIKLCKPYPIK